MITLRTIAAGILVLEGMLVVLAGSFVLRKLTPERIQGGSMAELWVTFAIAGCIYGIAAHQTFRGRPRTIAWITAVMSALIVPGWFRLIGAIPLLCLIAEVALPLFRKPVQPPPLPGAPPSTPAAENGSAVLEAVITLLAFFLYGLVWGLLPEWLRPVMPDDAGSWGWLSLGLALTACTFFHELGHAATGALVGFRMARFMVYPFDYARSSKHTYFRLNFKVPVAGLYMGFPRTTANLETRFLWMTAGGPLTGIAYSIFCWLVLWLAAGSITGIAFGFLYTCMGFGLATNLLNLVPFKSGQLRVDGRVLWDAMFDRNATAAAVALLGCASSLRSELRPRDWPPSWLQQIREHRHDFLTAVLLGTSAEDRLSHTPQDPEARQDLALCLDSLVRVLEPLKSDPRAVFNVEFHSAWLRSRYEGHKVPVDFAMASQDKEIEPYEILRLEAALLAADGRSEEAVARLEQAEASLAATQKSGVDAADLEGLRAFRQELLARA